MNRKSHIHPRHTHLTEAERSELRALIHSEYIRLSNLAESLHKDIVSLRTELGSVKKNQYLIEVGGELAVCTCLPPDYAWCLQELETLEAIKTVVDKNLAAIVKAMELFDTTTYGVCQRCGCAIPFKRLRIVPATTLCLACQEKDEGQKAVCK